MNDLYRLLDQAIKLHGSGNLAEAQRIYTSLLSADPSNSTALQFLWPAACAQMEQRLGQRL